ncbi:MAG: HD-GYP domain-containing protein [Ruminococcus sp.]|nr:HD-GYP domain-containing protein [Ruminococcus sp.]
MEKKKRIHKLSFQLILMTVILFVIGTAAGAVALYSGGRDLYLRAKNDMIERDLKDLYKNVSSNVSVGWFIDYCRQNSDYTEELTLREDEMYNNYFSEIYGEISGPEERSERMRKLSPEAQSAFAKREYVIIANYLSAIFLNSDYEKLYCIDISEGNSGFVFCDAVKTEVSDEALYKYAVTGTRWDYSADDHPAVKELRSGSGDEIVFEVASLDSSRKTNSYIGYLPLGRSGAALCISYDWTPLQSELMRKVVRLIVFILIGMLVTCTMILLFLRKVVIKPLSSVQLTLRDYCENKDSEAAAAHLKQITTQNEIGEVSGDVRELVREIDKYTDNLKKLSAEVMEALAHTIDAKDKYTNGHSFRVAIYSRMLAKELGLSPKEQEDIYYMGLLHDIGKIGIPNAIINKTSRLTDEEYEIIKKHPVFGYEILSEIRSMPELSVGARYHHERIDGRGYPDGLKGEEIPYMARIIAVADSYDTMTSNRSYREYLPQDAVREEIEKNIGTQFDEAPARAMLKIMDRDKDYMLHE